MGITLAEVLRLPSLAGAEVLAGHRALSRSVESVNVLEYGDVSEQLDQFFYQNHFEGNELIITAFANIRDNVEAQCANIRKCHSIGAVGFLLYYVGILLPDVDRRLIDLCDELDCPLICMPRGQINLRYSEAISEILSEVFSSHQRESYFVSDLLQRVSDLPPHQRNLEALMRMLSDHLHATVILSNPFSKNDLCVCWPRALIDAVEENLGGWLRRLRDHDSISVPLGEGTGCLQRCPILSNDAEEYRVYLLRFKDPLPEDVLWQTSELFRLFINIWNKNPGRLVTTEIVRAIINDDVVQMTRLSQMFNIDVGRLNQMWLFHLTDRTPQYSESLVRQVSEQLSTDYDLLLTSYYEENLVVFTCAPPRYDQRQSIREELGPLLAQQADRCEIVCCDCLQTTKSARNAYLDSVNYLGAARKLYPEKQVLCASDILFAKQCCQIMADQDSLAQYLEILELLRSAGSSLVSTAEIYLLDTSSNMAQTARRLFVHLNTIKYRLHLIQDLLGYAPGRMPDTYPLYMAVALDRLMQE